MVKVLTDAEIAVIKARAAEDQKRYKEMKERGTAIGVFESTYKKALKIKPYHGQRIEDEAQREKWLQNVIQAYIKMTRMLKELGFEQYEDANNKPLLIDD